MDENVVVKEVCKNLEGQGFDILQRRLTTEHGVDIIAKNASSDCTILVEAKGDTSSREGSARFGEPYTHSQVFDRVAKGVFTCFQLRAKYSDHKHERVLLAVPDSEKFRSYLEPICSELKYAGIAVIFVTESVL